MDSDHYCKLCHAGYTSTPFSIELGVRENVYHPIFHDECEKCSSNRPKALLCSFCTHLRPRHLFSHIQQEFKFIHIGLGDLAEIRTRASGCEFCEFLDRHPQFSRMFPWTKITLGLEEDKQVLYTDLEYTGDIFVDTTGILAVPASPGIQWDRIKGWLRCPPNQTSHGEPSPGQTFHHFRLIDVFKNCVVRISKPTSYATLSYVWGAPAEVHFEATKHNISTLEREGGLGLADVPTTIQDAILATKMLGLKYLWVDRICIVQDDDDSKLPQIYRMDMIFASSYVTFVAEGPDAMGGLPGVRVDRKETIQTLHLDGLTIGFPYWTHSEQREAPELQWDPGRSKWYERGWTYQEAVVSKRLLFFTHQGVFLDSENNTRIRVEGGTHAPRRRALTYSHPGYYEAVREITARNFTYSSDILLAFQGILNWIIETECHIEKGHRFGIPFEEFDLAILWDSENTAPKRSPGKRQVFPSWSWASKEARIDFVDDLKESCGSLATWAFCEKSAENQPYLVPVVSRPKRICDNWKHRDALAIMMIAWGGDHFAKGPPSDLAIQQRDFHFPTYDDFWQASRGGKWQQDMFSSDDIRIASMSAGRLMVHTQCALLDIEPPSPLATKKSVMLNYEGASVAISTCFIRNRNGKVIGAVNLPYESQNILSPLYMRTRRMRVEALAITVQFKADHIWQADKDSYDQFTTPPVVKVMLVHRCGSIAHRLAIGQVWLKLWVESNPKLKTVILE